MTDDLSIQGTLAETTVPDLFRTLIRTSESAIVSLDAVGRNDVIYFQEGKIVSATSSDPDMGLAEVLLRAGEINLDQYNNAMERLVVARRMGAVLVELGYLDADELIRSVEHQASAIILGAMAYRTGNYSVEFTDAFPDGIISIPLPTERLILDGIRHIDYWSLISRGIGQLDRMLEIVPGAEMRSYAIELNDDETHLLSFFAQPQTVESVCARSYLSNFATCRTLWGMLAVNLLQDAMSDEAVHERRAAERSEYELEGDVERYNTVFQKIFEIVFQKIGDHVYDFTDRVYLHLAPETLPYLAGMSLVNEGRIDIDQILNNIIASGSHGQTEIVHNVLNELLYGWIFEVKTEFGAEVEAQVVRLTAALR
jgi:hypothetical protein